MKILVTGAGGLIGSEAVDHYCSQGYKVYGIENNQRQIFFGEKGSTLLRLSQLEKYSNFTEVPYKGMSQALNDLLGKNIQIGFITGETQQRTDLIMLANTTLQTFRGIPSWSKCLGIDKKYTGQFLMITRASADTAFVSKMKKLVDEFVKDPDTVEYFKLNGFSRH